MILRLFFASVFLFSSSAYAKPSLLMEGLFHSDEVVTFEVISKREADMDMMVTPYVYDLSYAGTVLKDVYQNLSSSARDGASLGLAAQLWAVGC